MLTTESLALQGGDGRNSCKPRCFYSVVGSSEPPNCPPDDRCKPESMGGLPALKGARVPFKGWEEVRARWF